MTEAGMLLHELRQRYADGELPVAELARRIGRARSTVHRYMTGEVDPPLSLAERMVETAAHIIKEREAVKPIANCKGGAK